MKQRQERKKLNECLSTGEIPPLNRMKRTLSRLRRLSLYLCGRIRGKVKFLLFGALLVLAVTLFYVFSSKPVTTPEVLSLPEEFLSPFHTKVSDWFNLF